MTHISGSRCDLGFVVEQMAIIREKKSSIVAPKSRAKYSCPASLAVLMERVRCVPPHVQLDDIEVLKVKAHHKIRKTDGGDTFDFETRGRRLYRFLFNECFKHLPRRVRHDLIRERRKGPLEFLRREDLDKIKRDLCVNYYPAFVQFRHLLFSIAEYFAFIRKFGDPDLVMYDKELESKRPKKPLLTVALVRHGTDKLSAYPDEFGRTLSGVSGDRIRRCKVCLQIFWAKRSGTEYCSISCGQILRQRDRRERIKTTKLQRMELKLANLKASLSPGHIAILNLEKEIAKLRKNKPT